ncbi:MAG: dTMP kinase, partial [Thiomonas sp. 20-64-5]
RRRDRFEQESAEFFARVRAHYLQQAKAAPKKWLVVDGTQAPDMVQNIITNHLSDVLLEFDSK